MRKFFPLVLLLLCTTVASAQTRDAEWKSYALPQTDYARYVNAGKEFVFRVPADWKQEGTELTFKGPHSAVIRVYTQKIPDGYPLRDYFASMVRAVREQPGTSESLQIRRTQIQNLEARELFVEFEDSDGQILRGITWVAVNGPLLVSFILQAPVAHVAEVEPYFKAVVQSVIFLRPEHRTFEALRTTTLKSTAPGPIHEFENIVASLNEIGVDREAAVTRLTSLFSTAPDMAVDLLVDRRPLVRSAAVEALARSNNTALQPFVWEMLDDSEPFAAEAAARSLAGSPDLIAKILKYSLSGQKTETIARVWPFMTKEKRTELLQKIFNQRAVPPPSTATSNKPVKNDVNVKVVEMSPVKPGLRFRT